MLLSNIETFQWY